MRIDQHLKAVMARALAGEPPAAGAWDGVRHRIIRRRRIRIATALVAGLGLVAAGVLIPHALSRRSEVVNPGPSPSSAQPTRVAGIARISVSSGGVRGNGDSYSLGCDVSSDGRYVAFWSSATNLVPRDANGRLEDVFLRDRHAGTTTLVSVSSSGMQGNGRSFEPSVSDDGKVVAFISAASNLVPGDANGKLDYFIRDLRSGVTTRVPAPAGQDGFDLGVQLTLSANGRYVAYSSGYPSVGEELGAAIYVYDRVTTQTTRVSAAWTGGDADSASLSPAISADGRSVAFASAASNLVPGDTNGKADVFVRDIQAGKTVLASTGESGTQANGDSWGPSITTDGRYVAFGSDATNLAPGRAGRLFVRDRKTLQTMRVPTPSDEVLVGNSISGDGRYLTFYAGSAGVQGGFGVRAHVWLADVVAGIYTDISIADYNADIGFDLAQAPAISENARVVVFSSFSNDVISGNEPGSVSDVYAADLR